MAPTRRRRTRPRCSGFWRPAAGGRRAEVVGYLRAAEEAALGAPRSNGELRWALAEAIKALVLDTPVPGADGAPPA